MRLEDTNNAHSLAVLSIPPGSKVLDVGCADGSVAKSLRDRGCRVWGVEIDGGPARVAATVCEQVVVGDVETLDLSAELKQIDFDFVLLLDVLEHLKEPAATLRRLSPLLGPSGHIIASIPNVAHASVKLQLLTGRWSYTEFGLLDRTHLRFFDKVSIDQLFSVAGLTVAETLRVIRRFNETEIDIDPSTFPDEVIRAATADPESTTYQYVIVASPNPDGAVQEWYRDDPWLPDREGATSAVTKSDARPHVSLAEVLQTRVRQLEALVREGEEYAATLLEQIEKMRRVEKDAERYAESLVEQINEQKRHAEYAKELEKVLADRMTEIETLHDEVKHLRMDLAVRDAYVADLRAEMEEVAHGKHVADHIAQLEAELARLTALEFRVANSAGYRFVDRTYNGMRRISGLFHLVRAITRLFGRRRP